jgi:hypothetical protein
MYGFSIISKDDYANMAKQFYVYDEPYAFYQMTTKKIVDFWTLVVMLVNRVEHTTTNLLLWVSGGLPDHGRSSYANLMFQCCQKNSTTYTTAIFHTRRMRTIGIRSRSYS